MKEAELDDERTVTGGGSRYPLVEERLEENAGIGIIDLESSLFVVGKYVKPIKWS